MASRRRREPAVSAEARTVFLEAVAAGWSVSEAARRAVTPRTRFYDLKKRDEQFAAEWAEADAQGLDTLKDEIVRRGRDGWDEAVYQKGELAGYVRRYDSNLLLAEVRRRDPEYRDKQQLAVSGSARLELDAHLQIEPTFDPDEVLRGLIEAGVIDIWLTNNPHLVAQAAALQRKALLPGDDGGPTSSGSSS